MPKKTDERTQVRLDPDNDKRLKEISRINPLKPSIAKLVNLLVRSHISELEAK